MTDESSQQPGRVLADHLDYLVATAARAPSVHNTQPWRFRCAGDAIELYCDPSRKLRVDPAGREMLISCGAALFGLRLAVRSLGYLPAVELLPDRSQLRLLARVRAGAREPMTGREREMLEALPHRHTHRGSFAPGQLPAGLIPGLQHDALAERATLVLVDRGLAYQRLADIVSGAGRRLDLEPRARADIEQWSRGAAQPARDGIPPQAFPAGPGIPAVPAIPAVPGRPGRLRQRDFDLGRGLGQLDAGEQIPALTAVLVTAGDGRADWLRAGQALHRLLAHAASKWVFASLYTQPLEAHAIRTLIRDRLALPGAPQLLLQFGPAHSTQATARRPPDEVTDP